MADNNNTRVNINGWVDDTIRFPFRLDDFQCRAMQHVRDNEHVLVAAHTSAGKTTVAEFTINHVLSRGQRVVYTAPIKALSNQKYSDFRCKARSQFLHCDPEEIGIVTGDVQNNPDGRIIIATTEIVHNNLFHDTSYFDDVGAVIFDEVHYINDPERGRVWENAIVMMPSHVLMVMLSATIPNPERFTRWISTIKQRGVGLVTTDFRPVPLDHYVFWDDALHPLVVESVSHPTVYENIRRARLAISESGTRRGSTDRFNRTSFLNRVVQKLQQIERLPGFFFCFSRRLCSVYAESIERSLLSAEESACAVKRFRMLLHQNIDVENHTLPQIEQMERLLARGVAIHHSGLLPTLKEIVEALFAEGHVRALFVTETFAVGINLATRCIVLTDVCKHDGRGMRALRPDEYQQIAGRAGRRGLDTRGTCIVLPGLQRTTELSLPNAQSLLRMVIGNKAAMTSKFQLDGTFILSAIASDAQTLQTLLASSMMAREIDEQVTQLSGEVDSARADLEAMTCDAYIACTDARHAADFEQYCDFKQGELRAKQGKQRRRLRLQREALVAARGEDMETWEQAYAMRGRRVDQQSHVDHLIAQREDIRHSAARVTLDTLRFLAENGYVQQAALASVLTHDTANTTPDNESELSRASALDAASLTIKGRCSISLRECPPTLVIECLYTAQLFDPLTAEQIAAVLACTIDERFENDAPFEAVKHNGVLDAQTFAAVRALQTLHNTQQKMHDDAYMYYTGCVNPILAEYALLWCSGRTVAQTLSGAVEQIDLGNFVRTMLKLSSMLEEVRTVYAMLDHPNEQKISALQQRNAIIRDAVRVDSMYFRS